MFEVKGAQALDNVFADPCIPFGMVKETGELVRPNTGLPNGLMCGLVCPTCEGDIQFIEHTRRRRDGTPGGAYFRHNEKPPETFACYRPDEEDAQTPQYRNGDVESEIHKLMKWFIAWWFEDEGGRVEAPYEGTRFRSDAMARGTHFEVVVTSLPQDKKREHIMEINDQVILVSLMTEERQRAVCQSLIDWDYHSKYTKEDPHNIAESVGQKLYEYLFEDSYVLKEVKNRGFYRRQMENKNDRS